MSAWVGWGTRATRENLEIVDHEIRHLECIVSLSQGGGAAPSTLPLDPRLTLLTQNTVIIT